MSVASLSKPTMFVPASPLPFIGQSYGGGFVSDVSLNLDGNFRVLISAPRAVGETKLAWGKSPYSRVEGALSIDDGRANTEALNDAGHPAAQWCRGLDIGGETDWFLGAQVQNARSYANVGPSHTKVEIFKEGGTEAYRDDAYWSSTQSKFLEDCAWFLNFGTGGQGLDHKYLEFWVRAVREVIIPAIPQFPDA